ncbi:MAG: hypothetical protein R3C59_13810 [Planctomycetaceae bacterium]
MSRQQFRLLIAAPLVLTLCVFLRSAFQNRSDRVKVSGFVFLDDSPLTNADIFLMSDGSAGDVGDSAATSYISRSNDGGFYEIPDGVTPGNYRVVVRRLFVNADEATEPYQATDDIDSTQMQMMLAAKAEREQRRPGRRTVKNPVQQLPTIYSQAAETILRITVPDSGNQTADLYLSLQNTKRVASENAGHRN